MTAFSEEQVQQEARCLQVQEARTPIGISFFEQVRMANPTFSEEQVQQETRRLQFRRQGN